jgi:hypothetical protein
MAVVKVPLIRLGYKSEKQEDAELILNFKVGRHAGKFYQRFLGFYRKVIYIFSSTVLANGFRIHSC